MSEFEKYARNHCGISSLKLHDFQSVSAAYVSPTIIEERQLNIATMEKPGIYLPSFCSSSMIVGDT